MAQAPALSKDATWSLLAWSEGKDTVSDEDAVDIDLFD
jgi:hypothetical protein